MLFYIPSNMACCTGELSGENGSSIMGSANHSPCCLRSFLLHFWSPHHSVVREARFPSGQGFVKPEKLREAPS